MKFKKTNRGFCGGNFKDAAGTTCRIQESSSANVRCIWFGVENASPTLNGEPAKPLYSGHSTQILFNDQMHIDKRLARRLIYALEQFLVGIHVRKRKFFDTKYVACTLEFVNGKILVGPNDPNPQVCDQGWRPLKYPEGTVFNTHMCLGKREINKILPALKEFVATSYLK